MSEKKFYDGVFTSQNNLATWTFQDMPVYLLQQGTSANQRLGNKVYLHAIHVILRVAPIPAATGTDGTVCRLAVVHDKQNNGSTGAISGASIYANDDYLGLPNQTQKPRYKILRDWTHDMVVTGVTGAGVVVTAGPPHEYRYSIYPRKRIDFEGNTGTRADLLKDSWAWGFVAGAGACCKVEGRVQLIFSDM